MKSLQLPMLTVHARWTIIRPVELMITLSAAAAEDLERIVVAGGVACNSGLRSKFAELSDKHNVKVFFPSPTLCGDNAAMLGVPANYYLEKVHHAVLSVNAVSSWPLDSINIE